MSNEIKGSFGPLAGGAVAPSRAQELISRAGSSVSKTVQDKNLEQLQDFRSKLGLI